MFKNFDIAVDTTKGIRNQAISVNTNDLQTLQFSFTITQSGVPVNLTGATVRLAVKKPDKNTVFQDCTVTDATAGKCEIILDTQAYIVPGLHPVELMVYYEAGKVSVTGRFSYTANKGILDDETIQSTNEWQSITKVLVDAETATTDAEAAAISANAVGNETKYVEPYNTTTAYKKNNVVSFNGASYMAKRATTGNAPTDLPGDLNWGILSRKGTDGTGTVHVHKDEFIATEGQTVFTLEYTYDQFQNRTDVKIGGVPQNTPDNYEETTSNTITLSEGVPAGTVVEVKYFSESVPLQSDIQTTVDNHTVSISDHSTQLGVLQTIEINVKQPPYNATGNGSTDDTVAIQAAVAYIQSLPKTKAAKLKFPYGSYKVSGTFTLTNTWMKHIDAKEARFFIANAQAPDIFVLDNDSRFCKIEIGTVSSLATYDWKTVDYNTFTTNVVTIRNSWGNTVNIDGVIGAKTGVRLHANIDGRGTSFNRINTKWLEKVQYGIHLETENEGYVTANVANGGFFEGYSCVKFTKQLTTTRTANQFHMNTFYDFMPEHVMFASVDIEFAYNNGFYNFRTEMGDTTNPYIQYVFKESNDGFCNNNEFKTKSGTFKGMIDIYGRETKAICPIFESRTNQVFIAKEVFVGFDQKKQYVTFPGILDTDKPNNSITDYVASSTDSHVLVLKDETGVTTRLLRKNVGKVFVGAFLNSWKNSAVAGDFENAYYRQDRIDRVHLGGAINGGIVATNTTGVAFVLPVGFRPTKRKHFSVTASDGTIYSSAQITVFSNGDVRVNVAPTTTNAGSFVALDGISFGLD